MKQQASADRPHLATLVDTMETWGRTPAIVEHRGVRRFLTTYVELAAQARGFAAELNHRGIAPGERVLLWGRNSAAWVAAYFGCVLAGVLVVPLDAAGTAEFAGRVSDDVKPRLVVGDAELLALLPHAVPRFALGAMPAVPARDQLARPALSDTSPLQILFTSGTTGTPKGVVHTHGNLLASLTPIEREIAKYRTYERWVHPLRILHTLPLSHVFGQFMGLWVAPVLGATVHYDDRASGARLAGSIRYDRIHVLAAVPRTLELLRGYLIAQHPELPAQLAGAHGLPIAKRWWIFRRLHRRLGLRFWAAVCGGATLDAATEQFWSTLGFALIQGYGLTETAALVTLNHPFRIARGSLGAPLPGRDLRVNAAGELEVKGAMVSTATWQGGRVQQRADPWLATGDLAQIGDDGRVRFLGRSGQRLVTAAGLNVYLQDVETALTAQPAIREAMAIPLAVAAGGGEEPAAVLVCRGAEAAGAVAAANMLLAPHQQVRRWWVWPGLALPRTGTGKVARRQVQDWVAEQTGAPMGDGASGDPVEALLLSVGAQSGPTEDAARLDEDWRLDSMGRVALAAALEEQAGVPMTDEAAASLRTLGDVRRVLTGAPAKPATPTAPSAEIHPDTEHPRGLAPLPLPQRQTEVPPFHYSQWPWNRVVTAVRSAFCELVMRPLVWLLAAPRVRIAGPLPAPSLLLANHRTAVDVPLLLYALPGRIRRRVAVAMSGEMLAGWQNSWSLRPMPSALARHRRWWGPPAAFALRALFNVFPLPAGAGFRESFAHAGHALDRGFSVLIFPEGRRSPTQAMLPFKPGIGMLAQEAFVPVVPAALRVVQGGRLRGCCEVTVGEPVTLDTACSPERLARRYKESVEALLGTER